MERHKCKLCLKSFVNGRALGGHMRSHMSNLPISPGQLGAEPESASSHSSSSYYDDLEEEKGALMTDHDFSSSVVLQDRESETESSKNPTRKRSRRTRKPSYVSFAQRNRKEEELPSEKMKKVKPSQLTESASSVSDVTTTEEDIAFCLMMLSRHNWAKKEQEQESKCDEGDEIAGSNKKKTNYNCKCETCGKVFRSYQALGGHRASHKKNRATEQVQLRVEEQETLISRVMEKIHECPVCFKVFSSGQALGGHKRSHTAGSVVGETSPAKTSEKRVSLIDLNLPAKADDDDDVVSAVSDDDA